MGLLKRAARWFAHRVGVDFVAEAETNDLLTEIESREIRSAWRAGLLDDDELAEAAGARLDDDDIVEIAELRDLDDRFDTGPLDAVETIDDDPRTVYLHVLHPSADEGAYADRLDRVYREQYGRTPRGLHVPLTDLEELHEVDPSYFAQQAAPWLEQAEEDDNQPATPEGEA